MPGPVGLLERPSVAIANLLKGRPEMAIRGLLAPGTLAPEFTGTLGEMLAGQAKRDPLLAGIMDTVTDPLFILGTALSIRYPIAKLKNMLKVGQRWGVYTKRLGVVESTVLRGETLFAGSQIPKHMNDLLAHKLAIEGEMLAGPIKLKSGKEVLGLGPAFREFEATTGAMPTGKEFATLGAKLEAWDGAGPPMFYSRWYKKGVVTKAFSKPIKLTGPLQKLYDRMDEYRKAAFEKIIQPFYAKDSQGNYLHPSGPQEVKLAHGRSPSDPFAESFAWEGGRGGRGAVYPEVQPLRDYLPHIPVRSQQAEKVFLMEMEELARKEVGDFMRSQWQGMKFKKGRPMYKRTGLMVPDLEELQLVDGFNPKFADELSGAVESYTKGITRAVTGLAGRIERGAGWDLMRGKDIETGLKDVFKEYGLAPEKFRPTVAAVTEYLKKGQQPLAAQRITQLIARKDLKDIFQQYDLPEQVFRTSMGALDEMISGGEMAGAAARMSEVLQGTAQISKYSLNPLAAWTAYTFNIARPYAWTIKDVGRKLHGAASALPTTARSIFNDYVPVLQGRTNYKQTMSLMKWNGTRLWLSEKLQEPWAGGVPKKWRDYLSKKLAEHKGPFSYMNAMSGSASWFYFSTLGGNTSSAFQNLLQTFITTVPLIGTQATSAGVSRVTKQLTGPNGYFTLRAGSKGKLPLSDLEAMKVAFPRFSATPLAEQSLAENVIRGTLEQAWGAGSASLSAMESLGRLKVGTTKWSHAVDKAKRVAMAMFTGTERFNRLAAFEGAWWKGVQENSALKAAGKAPMTEQQLSEASQAVVRMTQFAAGPGQMPQGLMNIPAPFRQFLYFPMRFFGFLWESTRSPWGAGPGAAALGQGMQQGRNWGTIGRTLAASSAIYHGAKEALGVDLSGGLMFGALPLPQIPESPFFPFPIVPPIFTVPGLAVKAAFTEDMAPLERAAALMVPGGIAAQRLLKTYHPKYAKYDQRTPDGKIPIHNRAGGLIAAYTPMQLHMRALGLRPDDMEKEREMTGYLLKHRDQIRDIRRRFIDAVVDNNPSEAQEIQEGFTKMYPSLGALQVKPTDLEAARKRRELTRLQRILMTLPAAYRPYFQQMIAGSMGMDMAELLGRGGVEPGTPQMADVYGASQQGGGALPSMFGIPQPSSFGGAGRTGSGGFLGGVGAGMPVAGPASLRM